MSDQLAYPKEIAEAITKVMGADLYIQKRGKNAFHGYKFATVGDLLDKLQPLMAEAGLVIFQHEAGSDMLDNGNVMAIHYQFTLAHTSGAVWPEKPMHTGMSGCRNTKGGFDDKAANKCHTAARKYFLLGLFQVPTGDDYREGAHDAEPDAHEDAPAARQAPRAGMVRAADVPPQPSVRQASGRELSEGPGAPQKANGNGDATMSVEQRATIFREEMMARFAKCKLPADVGTIIKNNSKALDGLKKMAPEVYDEIMAEANRITSEMYGATG